MPETFFSHEHAPHAVSENLSTEDRLIRKRPQRRTTPNPSTPIPQRASAFPQRGVKIRPRYPRISEDLPREKIVDVPTQPPAPALWQYESAGFSAESSLPSLSLALSPTDLPVSPSIDELDTVPPPVSPLSPDIAELTTQPPPASGSVRKTHKLPPEESSVENMLLQGFPGSVRSLSSASSTSWTTGQNANSLFARRIAQKHARPVSQRSQTFHGLDRLRWWLLYPGRLEFSLWLSGTLLLLGATALLIVASLFSMTPLQVPAQSALSPTPSCPTKQHCGSLSVTSAAGVKLLIVDNTPLQVGKPFRLEGQNFTPHGTVNLTYDAWLPCQPATIHADEHGLFLVTVLLEKANSGDHRVAAYDVSSTHVVILPMKLVESTQQSVPSSTPAAAPQPIAPVNIDPTPTPASYQPGPVPVTPTSQPSPTPLPPTPVPATPTPQPTSQPTPKPPVSLSPTPVPVLPTPTPIHHSSRKSMSLLTPSLAFL